MLRQRWPISHICTSGKRGMLLSRQRVSCAAPNKRNLQRFRQPCRASSETRTALNQIVPATSLAGLALCGATLGPLLDGIHGTVHLLEYKVRLIQSIRIMICRYFMNMSCLAIPVISNNSQDCLGLMSQQHFSQIAKRSAACR